MSSFEWSKKSEWGKFGTRTRLFDHTDPTFGIAIDLFLNKYGSDLEQVFRTDKRIRNAKHVIVFAEFFGPRSFAGQHHPDDSKDLVIFDVNPHKAGLLGPKEFLDTFGHLKVAELVYQGNLNKEFETNVREGKLPGLVEGIIAKGGSRHDLWLCKIKTNAYREKLKAVYADRWADFWE